MGTLVSSLDRPRQGREASGIAGAGGSLTSGGSSCSSDRAEPRRWRSSCPGRRTSGSAREEARPPAGFDVVFSERVSTMTSTAIYGPETRRVDAAARAIPIGSTPSSWQKTFPNGGLPRLGLAGPWPGRGSAPGNEAHLGSPRVLHDLVVVIGHVAHRRVRRVRRVRGGVCPRGFRGKFLTDCVTVGSKPDAEKKESRVGRKDAGPACSTFLPNC